MPIFDFDAAQEEAESRRDPPQIRFGGKLFTFDAAEPSAVRLERAALRTVLRDAGLDPDDEELENADIPDEIREKVEKSNRRELELTLCGHLQELLDLGAGPATLVKFVNYVQSNWTAEESDPNVVRREVRRARNRRPTVIHGTGGGGSSNNSSPTGHSSRRTSGGNTASG